MPPGGGGLILLAFTNFIAIGLSGKMITAQFLKTLPVLLRYYFRDTYVYIILAGQLDDA